MFLPPPPLGRCWNTLPTIFSIIWLVRPIPCAKYTRTLYPYIPRGFTYSNPNNVTKGNIPVLSWYHIIHLLCGGWHNVYMTACSVPVCDTSYVKIRSQLMFVHSPNTKSGKNRSYFQTQEVIYYFFPFICKKIKMFSPLMQWYVTINNDNMKLSSWSIHKSRCDMKHKWWW